ncbi:MAG TPA: hypothetical protein DIU07_09720 [Rhodobacteraceae bacterium]|nr:hypothetical protein [Paracoccaceae bacterium]
MGRETYLYGRGGGTGAYFLLFFGVVIVGGMLLASSSASGIRVAGIGISPAIATLAYLCVAGFGGWLAWGEVQSERFKTTSQRPIELGPRAIVAPAFPDGRRMVKLSYTGITELKVDTGKGEPWLYIQHQNGKLAISAEAMESYSAFQRMLMSLELRVSLARGAMTAD